MSGAPTVAAWLLAVTFAWAAAAKLRRPAQTAAAFAALRLPAARPAAVAVPLAEAAVAVVLVVRPAAGGALALVLLVAFSAFLARRLRAGGPVRCGCFGSAHGDEASGATLARNAVLALAALAALAEPRPVAPALPALVAVTAAAATAAIGVAVADLKARTGRVWDNRLGTGPGAAP